MKQDRRGVTRRQIAVGALAVPAAVAQTPPAASEVDAARGRVSRNHEALRNFKVPQLLEPSFAFRP